MDLSQQLMELLDAHSEYFGAHAWPSEADRWAELVFCLLHRLKGGDAQVNRQATQLLFAAGLLNVETLAKAEPESTATAGYLLSTHGWSADEAEHVVCLLQSIARAISKEFAGKLQAAVRRAADEMRAELVAALTVPGLDRADLSYALTHWLQNAFNLPISLDSEAVRVFRRKHHLTPAALTRAADALDLNVALLDDVLEAHIAARPAPARHRRKAAQAARR
jgi:hypothetical protein